MRLRLRTRWSGVVQSDRRSLCRPPSRSMGLSNMSSGLECRLMTRRTVPAPVLLSPAARRPSPTRRPVTRGLSALPPRCACRLPLPGSSGGLVTLMSSLYHPRDWCLRAESRTVADRLDFGDRGGMRCGVTRSRVETCCQGMGMVLHEDLSRTYPAEVRFRYTPSP